MSPTGSTAPSGLKAELCISPRPVIVLLLFPAVVLVFMAPSSPDPGLASALAILFYVLTPILWAIHDQKEQLGRWTTVLALIAVIPLTRYILPIPGLFAIFALSTVLSAAVIGLSAMIPVAVVETVLLVLAVVHPPDDLSGGEIGITLLLVWGLVGTLQGMSSALGELVRWSWDHFEYSRTLLEEVSERQVQQKEMLDALAHANRELALANDRLAATRLIAEEARKSKASFVANVSHELRTPLNIVIGLADVLLRRPRIDGQELSPSVREDLAMLYRNCEHLSSMINDILDLSQVEAGRLALHREWVDLSTLVNSALKIVSPLLKKKDLAMSVMIPPDLPSVYCDPRRIRQVVLNLLGNAARFTEKGSITVQAEVDESFLQVSVTDTGPGISVDDAERIFEPFQQSATGPWTSRNGSGLGLSISKQFVELHDGQMGLQSQLGVGSTFYFRLPFVPPAGPRAAPARWIVDDWAPRNAQVDLPAVRLEQRLILCDPTGEAYPLLIRYADQVEFIDTRNPAEALQACERLPALAIWVNAHTLGELWALTEEIRAGKPDMPIVGCSLPPRATLDLSGASGVLLKPVLYRQLEEAIGQIDRAVRRVLIADDDPDTIHMLSKMLRACDENLEIIAATDGRQALDEMRRRLPDLVLLDLIMPDMNGWQVLAAKAAEDGIRDIPILILSATDLQDHPVSSRLVLGTMGEGLSLNKLLCCAQTLANLLLQPDSAAPG
ncbi:MAG: hybrid sensor histidine kinase/response regulator [Chloroflexi bacterium]|nr:hybrid sensor histidine kinase/response regulator [Chloroflexota bacterium]